jgi:crotonobetainyl-CoA:carnitine CoA-transferase CaiB-like acyl-CoA transferase
MSGMMSAQGGDDEPVYLVAPVNDAATAPMIALQACLALLHRANSGEGQRGWVSLAGVSAFVQAGEIVSFEGRPAPPVGGRDFAGPTALCRYYATSDGWIRLESDPDQRATLAAVLGDPSIALSSDDKLAHTLAVAIEARTRDELVAALTAAGIPAAPARTRDDLIADLSLQSAGILERRNRVNREPWLLPDHLVRLSGTERRVPLNPPGIGEHSVDLLLEAGLTAEEVATLIDEGIVVAGPPEDFSVAVNYK